jgi:hypothetical protein
MSWPHTLAVPALGESAVVSIRIIVVFPAPLGPSTPITPAPSTPKESSSTATPVEKRRVSAAHSMEVIAPR